MAWRDGFVHNSSRHFEDLPKHINFIQNMLQSGIKKIAVMGSMHEIGFSRVVLRSILPAGHRVIMVLQKMH